MNDEQITKLMQQAEDALVDDAPEKAAEALQELAHVWAKAGVPQSSFLDLRKHLVQAAEGRTSAPFINEKLRVAEQLMRENRNDRTITNH